MSAQKDPAWSIGKYAVRERIGAGGFGTVYHAYDTVLEVDRAIKILHPALNHSPEFISRFGREARLVARIEHQHIVPVYDFGHENARYFLVMRLMTGGSLGDLLKNHGALSFQRGLVIIGAVARALDYAHSQGLIHRDVKPGNVLFEADGSARLGDFGFARALTGKDVSSLSLSGGLMGTPSYMAPELWRNQPAGPASDVYALACMVTEMFSGQVLFPGDSPAEIMTSHVLDGPRFPERWPPDAPNGLAAVLQKALARRPEERFASAGAFFQALRELKVQPVQPIPQPRAEPVVPTQDPAEKLPGKPPAAEKLPAAAEKLPVEQPGPQAQQLQAGQPPSNIPGRRWARFRLNRKLVLVGAAAAIMMLVGIGLAASALREALVTPTPFDQGGSITGPLQTLLARQTVVFGPDGTPTILYDSGFNTPAPVFVDQATQTPQPELEEKGALQTLSLENAQRLTQQSPLYQTVEARINSLAASLAAGQNQGAFDASDPTNWPWVQFEDILDEGSPWQDENVQNERGQRRYFWQDGMFFMEAQAEQASTFWAASLYDPQVITYATMDVKITSSSYVESPASAGMAVLDNPAGFYRFEYNPEGLFHLDYFDNSTQFWVSILDWQFSSALSLEDKNNLSVRVVGDTMLLMINDQIVGEVLIEMGRTGTVAPLVSLFSPGDSIAVEIDNFNLQP